MPRKWAISKCHLNSLNKTQKRSSKRHISLFKGDPKSHSFITLLNLVFQSNVTPFLDEINQKFVQLLSLDKSINYRQIELNTNQVTVRLFVIVEQLCNNSISLSFKGNFCLSVYVSTFDPFPHIFISRGTMFSRTRLYLFVWSKKDTQKFQCCNNSTKNYIQKICSFIINITIHRRTHIKSDDSEKQIESWKEKKQKNTERNCVALL